MGEPVAGMEIFVVVSVQAQDLLGLHHNQALPLLPHLHLIQNLNHNKSSSLLLILPQLVRKPLDVPGTVAPVSAAVHKESILPEDCSSSSLVS